MGLGWEGCKEVGVGSDMSRTPAIIISYFAFRVPGRKTIGNDVFFCLAKGVERAFFHSSLFIVFKLVYLQTFLNAGNNVVYSYQ